MIEELIYEYLDENALCSWFPTRPEDKPTTPYGIFTKTNSVKSDGHLTFSTFAFQSYGSTLLEAAQISAELRALIEELPRLTTAVSKAELAGESDFTNPSDKQPRYQAIYQLVHFDD